MESVRAFRPGESPSSQQLDSWKEIAAYLKRGVRTVRRWEKEEGLPVRRHHHSKLASVYAYRSELDAWLAARAPRISEAVLVRAPVESPPQQPGAGLNGQAIHPVLMQASRLPCFIRVGLPAALAVWLLQLLIR